ncbi:ribosome hibernation promoting factor [Marinobacter sp.]|uniref:ribosome hibernation promoting factor n=1 Tax=Marinobacter sp. TaxID=50741 RepID=UPI003566E4B3
MQLNISGHHVELTPSLKDYVTEKFDKLERHFDHISNCQVTLEVEKVRQIAEGTLHVAGGGEIHAKAEDEDMYAAIDALIDKLDRQVLKHKEKNVDRMHGNGQR